MITTPANVSIDGNELTSDYLHTISGNTDIISCGDLVKGWLRDCQENHDECAANSCTFTRDSRNLPTRILDVGREDGFKVYVCEPESSATGPYLTLSHRWGSSEMPQLTAKTKSSFMKGILVSELPKTFRDAITVTRFLGIRFLWIDCLCILQDSLEDWRIESALMGDIYRRGLCNIAASIGGGSDSGLFLERDLSMVLPITVLGKSIERGPARYLWKSNTWLKEIESSPLNKRAWVCQERLLAQRVLHFGKNQIFWECSAKTACETFPTGSPRIDLIPGTRESNRRLLDGLRKYKNSKAAGKKTELPEIAGLVHSHWWSFLWSYSRCGITKGEDKLIAISGIAKEMRTTLGGEYLAGLWQFNLCQDLLWFVEFSFEYSSRRPERARPWRAPTWSWASIDGDITIPEFCDKRVKFKEHEDLITVMSVEISPIGDDVTGQLESGSIVLRGRCIPGTIGNEIWPDQTDPDSRTGMQWRINIYLRDNSVVVADLYYDCMGKEYYRNRRCLGDSVWCLPVLYSRWGDEENKWQLDGLIIKRDPKALPLERWERLGMFTMYSDDIKNTIQWPNLREEWFGKAGYQEEEIVLI
ncbi:heterokaryon incompatibility protein [Rutstroemia sp. NJR-2017a BVV2]|nr:heterokaryon incompatibility protein [Rutstroemia sp. NJR-2017a BVV2]